MKLNEETDFFIILLTEEMKRMYKQVDWEKLELLIESAKYKLEVEKEREPLPF